MSVSLFLRQNGWTDRVKINNAQNSISKFANFFVCYCFVLYTEKILTDRATIQS